MIRLSKPIKCAAPKVNPDVNSTLSPITRCLFFCRFINSNRGASLVEEVDIGVALNMLGQGPYGKYLDLPLIFSVKLL